MRDTRIGGGRRRSVASACGPKGAARPIHSRSVCHRPAGMKRAEAEGLLRTTQELARGGASWAQSGLGHLYEMGRFVRRNRRAAWFWYRKAAKQKDPAGLAALGRLMLEHGHGGRRSISLLRAATRSGESSAPFFLGLALARGLGGTAAAREARHAFALAKRRGFESGRVALSMAYCVGFGGRRSLCAARRLAEAPARRGEPSACAVLAFVALRRRVKGGSHEAERWLRRGGTAARRALNRHLCGGQSNPFRLNR